MGLFDKIKKAADVVSDLLDDGQINGSNKPQNAVPVDGISSTDTIDTSTLKKIEFRFDNINASFDIPAAFGEFESHAEPEMCCMLGLDPAVESSFDLKKPVVCVTPEDFAWDPLDEFELQGTVSSAKEFTRVDMKYFKFKAKADYYKDQLVYWYGGSLMNDTFRGLALIYGRELAGTARERELMQILDNAANSYSETVLSD